MMQKIWNPKLVAFSLLIACGAVQAGYKDVRMVHIAMHNQTDTPQGIPSHFLERAKSLGYTHVIGEINLDAFHNPQDPDWNLSQGTYRWTGPQRLYTTLIAAYAKVHTAGLIFVPKIHIGSRHSRHWKSANSNILFNYGKVTNQSTGNEQEFYMPPYAPDKPGVRGIDTSFRAFLQVVKSARAQAGITGLQDYIAIGHDEIFFQQNSHGCAQMLIGQNPLNGDRDYARSLTFTSAGANPPAYAFHRVMQQELVRRITQVRQSLGISTKVMVNGDAWDPESNGDAVFQAWFGNSCTNREFTTKGAAYLSGMEVSDQNILKESAVFVPWQYNTVSIETGRDYNTPVAFNWFSSRGLKFLWCAAIADNTEPHSETRVIQFRELVESAANANQSMIKGFVAWNWLNDNAANYHYDPGDGAHIGDGKQVVWNTMEHMAYWTGVQMPALHTSILPLMMIE